MNESYRGPRLTTAKLSQIICYILSHNPYTVIQVSLIQLYAQYFSNRQPFLIGNWKLYLSMFSSKPDSIFKTSTLTLLNMRAAGLQLPQSVSLCYCVTVKFKPFKKGCFDIVLLLILAFTPILWEFSKFFDSSFTLKACEKNKVFFMY